jgi:glutamate N-acetyltransferase/amino-acid N-acetyltransferase
MLTTDTVRKEATAPVGRAIVGGMAKGAAMLSPAMATMLAVLTTDAGADPWTLQVSLARAVSETFDCLSVDGCRSTNDTVIVLANGRAGAVDQTQLTDALTYVCGSLADQMARDAEGATKLVRVRVVGARTSAEARVAARAVANSQLVQCSLNGGDAYWGRVLSELGASGAFIEPEQVDIAYNGVTVCRNGIACAHDDVALAAHMAGREIDLYCDLHRAHGQAVVLTTDLSHAYIDENRRTS